MNREIKFRIFHTGKMWEPFEPFGAEELSLGASNPFPDDTVIMQFTGLKDKNGKEIYEGDWLLITAGYASKVEFQNGCFVSVYSHPEDEEIIPLFDGIGKDTEVVGNIYQPETKI